MGLLLLGGAAVIAQAAPIVLVDSKDAAYLKSGPAVQLEEYDVAALLASFSGLLPGQPIDEALSQKVIQVNLWMLNPHPSVCSEVWGGDALLCAAIKPVHQTCSSRASCGPARCASPRRWWC